MSISLSEVLYPADALKLMEKLGVLPGTRILWLGAPPSGILNPNLVVADLPFLQSLPLPYGDLSFDLAICQGVLQQVQDPSALCLELSRVALRGYIEVPSSLYMNVVGSPEDRWMFQLTENLLLYSPMNDVRHPLSHIGRKLFYSEPKFRQALEEHRSLFYIPLVWEGSITCRMETSGTEAREEDPLRSCAAWVDLALNCMSFDLPQLEEDIRYSLQRAQAILPESKLPLAVEEIYNQREKSGKTFYMELIEGLRKKDLVEAMRRSETKQGTVGSAADPSTTHYEILRLAYPEGQSHPLVSIIVRTFNRPELLTRCLESLNQQIYPSIEIIVVNDGGPDVGHLLASCKSPCHYIRHGVNKGKAAALNSGLRAAEGEYINIVDDDDLPYPDHIALLVASLERSDHRAAYTDSLLRVESLIDGEWRSLSKKRVYSQPFDSSLLLQTNYLPVLSMLFERSLLEECGYADERLEVLEDWDLWIRFSRRVRFRHLPLVTSEYTQRAEGTNATQEQAECFAHARLRIAHKYTMFETHDPIESYELIVSPQPYRSRLLSILLTAETVQTIRDGMQAFIIGFQGIPWAELVVLHRLAGAEKEALEQETGLLTSVRTVLVSEEELDDPKAFRSQFDIVIAEPELLVPTVKADPLYGSLLRYHSKIPLLSLVVLTKNQLDYTKLCIDSILRHTRDAYELIIVDNGSTDGTRSYLNRLAAAHPHIKLILNSDNKGYGGGNNQGLSVSTGEWVVVLNNDVIVTRDWTRGLMDAMAKNPKCGIVGPVSNYVPAPQQVRDPLYKVTQLDSYAASRKQEYAGQTLAVHRVIGFCMLVKREVLEAIGGFDLRYEYGNFEDDDFCIRAWLAGYEISVAQDVFIHHFGSVTFHNEKSLDYETIYHANFYRFIQKWNIPLDDGEYNGWSREDLGSTKFRMQEHYSPMIPDRSVTSYLECAAELFQLRSFGKGEACLLQCLAVHGNQQVVRYNLLVIYMQTRNMKMAEECLKYLDETLLEVGYLKVIWFTWAGRKEEAAELLERLTKKYPKHPRLVEAGAFLRK